MVFVAFICYLIVRYVQTIIHIGGDIHRSVWADGKRSNSAKLRKSASKSALQRTNLTVLSRSEITCFIGRKLQRRDIAIVANGCQSIQ